MCSVIMSTSPTEGPKNWLSTTFRRGRTSILYMIGFSEMPRAASVSLSGSVSSLSTWLYSLYKGSKMKCTNVRFASGSAGLRENLRVSLLNQMSPHRRSAKALTSTEPAHDGKPRWMNHTGPNLPYVSAYICAKDLRVTHHAMSVLAKATFPFSGLSRSSGSGLIPLSACQRY